MRARRVVVTGQRFGRWVVVREVERRGQERVFLVRCDCGAEKSVDLRSLTRGLSQQCKHCSGRAHSTTHGQSDTVEYRTWRAMFRRCTNPRTRDWPLYGGRGIRVCERWSGVDGFVLFLADLGPKPSPQHSIDRIDSNGNYEPLNCRWATPVEQRRNQRRAA